MINRRATLHLVAFVAFAGYALILLHPLWAYSGTRVAGYDYFNYNWNFWWIRYAWANGLNIYQNDFVMFPALSNYGYHALSAFWYPVWAILEPWIGTLNAINVIITTACILNGYLLFVWLRSEGIHPGLALLGGILLQTLPITRYWYYNTHLNLMDWFWIPILLLMWKDIYRAADCATAVSSRAVTAAVGRGVLFGVGLWGLLLTDLQFPIFATFIVVPYGFFTLWRLVTQTDARQRVTGLALLVGSGGVAIVSGILLMWFAGPLPYIAAFSGGLVPGPVEDRPGIPFPVGWFTMAVEWWMWDQPSVSWFVSIAFLTSICMATYLALTQKTRGIPHFRRGASSHWFWFWVAIPPFVLAMGPTLQVGDTMLSMPFVALYDFTNGNFRMPWRLAPAGLIAASAFIGLLWTPIIEGIHKRHFALGRLVPLAGAGILLLSHAAIRLFETAPLEPVLPHYDGYVEMREDDEAYVVVDVPTGMGTGEVLLGNARAIQYQWYGMTHEKRMINGFISRAPIENFYYVDTGDALLSWLGQRRLLDPVAVRHQLEARIYAYPIGYFVLHTDDIARQSPTATDEIVGFFNQNSDLLCPPVIEGAAVFYRTRWHSAGCQDRQPREIMEGVYEIDIGNPEDRRFIGWGWYYGEPVGGIDWRWMGGEPQVNQGAVASETQTMLYLDLPPGTYEIQVVGQSYAEPRRLALIANGLELETLLLFEPLRLREATSESFSVIGSGSVTLTLRASGSVSPSTLGQGADNRLLSIAIDRMIFRRVER